MLRYQVTELAPGRLRVLARVAGVSAGAESAIRSAVREAAGVELDVEVLLTDRFSSGPNGKFRVVQAALPGPAASARGTRAPSPADG
jgi:hypothetical protein